MSQLKAREARPRRNGRIPSRAIQSVVKQIAENFDPERVILFGSYAYGRPHQYSDVDLLVILETEERPRAKQI
jgi:predicted nucleotidyltransferase